MFSKSSYSDLEVQEILQTIFQEKKKVKELELKLQHSTLTYVPTPVSREVKILQEELDALRYKWQSLRDLRRELESLKQAQASNARLTKSLDEEKELHLELRDKLQHLEQELRIKNQSNEAESLRAELTQLKEALQQQVSAQGACEKAYQRGNSSCHCATEQDRSPSTRIATRKAPCR